MKIHFALAASFIAVCGGGASVSAQVGGFSDVPKNHWAADSVAKLAQAGIVTGYPQDSVPVKPLVKPAVSKLGYDGNKPVTRYELATILYRFVTYIERADRQKKSKMGVDARPIPKSSKEALSLLVGEGYLSAKSPFATNGMKLVTASELTTVLSEVITKSRQKTTPPSPDGENSIPQPNHP